MANEKERTRNLMDQVFGKYQTVLQPVAAWLGTIKGVVKVPSRAGYVYARFTTDGEAIEVANLIGVPTKRDLPVLVGYEPLQPTLLQILAQRAIPRYGEEIGTIPTMGKHARQHEWPRGTDIVYSQLRQLMPLRLGPGYNVKYSSGIGSGGGGMLSLAVYRGQGYFANSVKAVEPTNVFDMSAYMPSSAGTEKFVLVSVNTAGAIIFTSGQAVTSGTITLSNIPAMPANTAYILGAVRLYYGQTQILEGLTTTDILDLRFPMRHTHSWEEISDAVGSGGIEGGIVEVSDVAADLLVVLPGIPSTLDFQFKAPHLFLASGSGGVDLQPRMRTIELDDLPDIPEQPFINVYHISGGLVSVTSFNPNSTGVAQAMAAAVSGDSVKFPHCDITVNFSIPAGVIVVGMDRASSIIRGTVTLGAESSISNVSVLATDNSFSNVYGIILPSTGTGRVRNSKVLSTQSGMGDASAVFNNLAGEGIVEYSDLEGSAAGSGQGVAAMLSDTSTGNINVHFGSVKGSTGRFSYYE